MALTTYAELETAVANWLARDDLTTYIPDFITLFEADANLELQTRLQTTSTTLTPSSGSVTIPSDMAEIIRVTYNGSTARDLDYVDPNIFVFNYPTSPTADPEVYTIEGSTLKIMPIDNSTSITIGYKQKITSLASSVNWLFTNYPNLYLWGTLCEAQGFNIDFDKMQIWKSRRDEIYDKIKKKDFRSPETPTIRPEGYTP